MISDNLGPVPEELYADVLGILLALPKHIIEGLNYTATCRKCENMFIYRCHTTGKPLYCWDCAGYERRKTVVAIDGYPPSE